MSNSSSSSSGIGFVGLLTIVFIVMKLMDVITWSWWWVLSPFAGAALWWTWADWSGYTKRKAMEREDQRKLDRINRQRAAIGQKPKAAPPRRR